MPRSTLFGPAALVACTVASSAYAGEIGFTRKSNNANNGVNSATRSVSFRMSLVSASTTEADITALLGLGAAGAGLARRRRSKVETTDE